MRRRDIDKAIRTKLEEINALLNERERVNQEETEIRRKWITVKECAEAMRISQPTVYTLINSGKLTFKKFGGRIFIKKDECLNVQDSDSEY